MPGLWEGKFLLIILATSKPLRFSEKERGRRSHRSRGLLCFLSRLNWIWGGEVVGVLLMPHSCPLPHHLCVQWMGSRGKGERNYQCRELKGGTENSNGVSRIPLGFLPSKPRICLYEHFPNWRLLKMCGNNRGFKLGLMKDLFRGKCS